MKYQHLTQCQRSQIAILKSMEHSQTEIARGLSVHPSTICRELKRNQGLRGYRHKQAHHFAVQRRLRASKIPKKITIPLVDFIEQKITEEQWSPEQIAGIITANGNTISHTRIYQHIWKDRQKGGQLFTHLRHRGKKYNYKGGKKSGRGCIPERVDIADRPKIVETKSRIGDWEGDTIIGRSHRGAIVSLVDRKSKFTLLGLVPRTTAKAVTQCMEKLFKSHQGLPKRTATFDNGKEFSNHQQLAKNLNIQCYFATPYHSWERGLNEHTNGLVRQYLPKGTDFTEVSYATINEIQDKLNNRSRKVLGWRTPLEVLHASVHL